MPRSETEKRHSQKGTRRQRIQSDVKGGRWSQEVMANNNA